MSRNTDFYMRCDDRLIKSEISGAQMWEIPIWVLHLSPDISTSMLSYLQHLSTGIWAMDAGYLKHEDSI